MAESFSNGVYTDSASGHPLQTTDGLFIPELWTAQLLQDLEANLILGSSMVTNRNYEGEFRRGGDVLHVPHFVDTVEDYGTKQAYDSFADNEMDHAELEYIKVTVEKGSSFRFEVDSLHQLQTQAGIDLMSNLVAQRARKTAQTIDYLIAQTITAATVGKDLNSITSNKVPTTLTGTPGFNDMKALHDSVWTVNKADTTAGADTVYSTIIEMIEKLDSVSAPQDRYLIVAPAVRSALLQNKDFIDAAHWGGQAVMPSGVIGQVLGVPVYVSNQLTNTTTTRTKKLAKPDHDGAAKLQMIMGSTNAVSLLIPHAEMAAYNPEKSFTAAVKSRLIYDAKVTRPEQLVVATDYAAPTT